MTKSIFSNITLSKPERAELLLQAPHLKYALAVLDGEQVAGELCIAACQRALYEHVNQGELFDGRWFYDFRGARAVFHFFGFLPHVRGEYARRKRKFELPDWQRFWLGEIHGWRSADNILKRRFIEAILEVGKKNGKTTLASGCALHEAKHGDAGAEIYSVATKADQAKKCWTDAGKMLGAMPAKMRAGCKIRTGEITTPTGEFKYLSRETKTLDGIDPSLLIVDEAAAIEDASTIEKTDLSTASRISPLTLYITHPQYSTLTHYYELREDLRAVLEGAVPLEVGERTFGVIYCQDSEDEIHDESKWLKSNPNLGVSVQLDFLRQKVKQMETRPSTKNSVKTYHFGFWLQSADKWMDGAQWNKCKGEVVREGKCFVGIDLSATQDLSAICRLWVHGNYWHVDFRCWTTEGYLAGVPEKLQRIYEMAQESGVLEVQDEPVIDYEPMKEYIIETQDEYGIWSAGVDPWNAKRFTNELNDEGISVLKVPQSPASLNDPRQDMENKITSQHLVHDGDPFIRWQLENCVADKRDDVLKIFRSPTNEAMKIDALAAGWTCIRCVQEGVEPEQEFRVRVAHFDR